MKRATYVQHTLGKKLSLTSCAKGFLLSSSKICELPACRKWRVMCAPWLT